MTDRSLMRGALGAVMLAAPLAMAMAGAGAELQLGGQGPYYRLDLPLSWQAQSDRFDLSDVRIFNGQGETLPYAWIEAPDPVAVEQQTKVPLFKWAGPKRPLTKTRDGAVLPSPTSPSWPIWVMDLRKVQGRLQQVRLSVPEGQAGIFAVAVEASMDLQSWTTIQDKVQLASLSHQGQTLHQEAIELGGISASYVRIRLLPGSPEPTWGEVVLSTRQDARSTPAWSWGGAIRATRCGERFCDYAVPAQVAIGRIKVHLAQANTLLSLEVLGQPADSFAAAHDGGVTSDGHRHGLRNRLRDLRHKAKDTPVQTRPVDDEWAGWAAVSEGQVHWIDQGDRAWRSEELPMDHGHYRMLRLSTARGDGGWTRHPPSIEVGSWMRSLVFLARGTSPYRLGWAGQSAQTVSLPMSQLVPAAGQEPVRVAGRAALPNVPASRLEPVVAPAASKASASAQKNQAGGWFDRVPKAWWLWAVLLAGLGLMAWMARALLSGPASGPPEQR